MSKLTYADRVAKANRLYDKFCKDTGLDAANLECVSAATEWHRLRQFGGVRPYDLAISEARLCESIEKVEHITRKAGAMASIWSETDEEPV